MAPSVCIKWTGKEYTVELKDSETVGTLKKKLEQETNVLCKRQKILGLKTKGGKPADDTVLVSELQLKPGVKYMMLGTPEAVLEETAAAAEAAPEVVDDFDAGAEAEVTRELKDHPEVQERLERRIASVTVKVLNPPRAGKKCLVLDIDYTLFDLNSSAETPAELARPFLHEFLASAYEHYDLVIWSATSMKWVEVKMKELGVSTHEAYKLVCMLDHSAMLTVHTERYGVFDCKPLAFLWAKFPEYYNASNTIMFDDLRRNYVLNRKNGLVIRPYKRAALNRATDCELLHLGRYLSAIAPLDSLAELDHDRWERYLARHPA